MATDKINTLESQGFDGYELNVLYQAVNKAHPDIDECRQVKRKLMDLYDIQLNNYFNEQDQELDDPNA